MANCKELHPDIDGQETQAYKDCVAKKKAEEKLLAEGLKTAKPQVIELDEVVVEDKLGGSIKPLKIPKTNAEGLEIIEDDIKDDKQRKTCKKSIIFSK